MYKIMISNTKTAQLLVGSQFYVLAGSEAGVSFESVDECGTRLESDALAESLDSEVAVVLAVGHAATSFLHAIFVDECIEVATVTFVDYLRYFFVVLTNGFSQLLSGKVGGVDFGAVRHRVLNFCAQSFLVFVIQVALSILLCWFSGHLLNIAIQTEILFAQRTVLFVEQQKQDKDGQSEDGGDAGDRNHAVALLALLLQVVGDFLQLV